MIKYAGLLTAIVFLGGCAGVPAYDIPSPVTVANIIDRIECEAFQATKQNPMLVTDRWVGVADLYLQVDDSAGLTPALRFIEPLARAGTTFAFGASGILKRSRQRLYSETIRIDMAKLNGKTCQKYDAYYDLTGELGIVETMGIALASIDKDNTAAFSDKVAFGQTLQFVLTRNVSGVGPTWTLTHFIGPGGLFGAERIDTHKLIVSFTPGKAVTKVVEKDGKKKLVVVPLSGAIDRAIRNNQNLLLQSLPAFQGAR